MSIQFIDTGHFADPRLTEIQMHPTLSTRQSRSGVLIGCLRHHQKPSPRWRARAFELCQACGKIRRKSEHRARVKYAVLIEVEPRAIMIANRPKIQSRSLVKVRIFASCVPK